MFQKVGFIQPKFLLCRFENWAVLHLRKPKTWLRKLATKQSIPRKDWFQLQKIIFSLHDVYKYVGPALLYVIARKNIALKNPNEKLISKIVAVVRGHLKYRLISTVLFNWSWPLRTSKVENLRNENCCHICCLRTWEAFVDAHIRSIMWRKFLYRTFRCQISCPSLVPARVSGRGSSCRRPAFSCRAAPPPPPPGTSSPSRRPSSCPGAAPPYPGTGAAA